MRIHNYCIIMHIILLILMIKFFLVADYSFFGIVYAMQSVSVIFSPDWLGREVA